MARPAWPAPMITVLTVLMGFSLAVAAAVGGFSAYHHRDVGRIGDDVVHRGALLRLRHQSLDVLALGVGVDVVGDLDAAETVAHIAVDAEDALDVHVALDRRRHRAQLDIAML